MGGADKQLDMAPLLEEIPRHCKAVVLLCGDRSTGSLQIKDSIHDVPVYEVNTMEGAVKEAFRLAKAGDTILFSPAFTSFDMFQNEYERGEKFIEAVKKLTK